MLQAQPRQGLVTPVHRHVPRPGLIGRPRQTPRKVRAFDRRIYHHRLRRLYVHPHSYHEAGIFIEQRFLHANSHFKRFAREIRPTNFPFSSTGTCLMW